MTQFILIFSYAIFSSTPVHPPNILLVLLFCICCVQIPRRGGVLRYISVHAWTRKCVKRSLLFGLKMLIFKKRRFFFFFFLIPGKFRGLNLIGNDTKSLLSHVFRGEFKTCSWNLCLRMCTHLCLGDDSRPCVDSTSGVIISTIILLSSQYLYTDHTYKIEIVLTHMLMFVIFLEMYKLVLWAIK